MRMTYVEYKMHNVLLNNSQPIIGPYARRCVSLMDLCFLRTRAEGMAAQTRGISFVLELVRPSVMIHPVPIDRCVTRASTSGIIKKKRKKKKEKSPRYDERAAFSQTTRACINYRALSLKLPNYKIRPARPGRDRTRDSLSAREKHCTSRRKI